MSARPVASLFVLLLVVFAGVYAFQAGLADAGQDNVIENETWTPDAGNWTTLEYSQIDNAYYTEEVTVHGNSGDLMVEGTDYEWNASDGRVKAVAGGDLAGGQDATISYGYEQTTKEQRELTGLLALLPRIVGVVFVVVGFLLFLMFING